MHLIDWLILIVPLTAVIFIGWRARQHVKAVSDFLAGGRVAGRYLLTIAIGEAGLGLITMVAQFQFFYKSGFAIGFWWAIATPIYLLVTLTGFAVYRYRETRAMTMGQFMEIRYSKRLRIFASLLCWVSGVLNFAIFPAVGARFIVHYSGLPAQLSLFPGLPDIPTFALFMFGFLTLAVIVVFMGGQLTTMVTDCVAALFSYWMYAVIVVAIFVIFSWSQMTEAMQLRPPGESMLNPFDTEKLQDFNIGYVLIGILGNVYGWLSWQGSQGYNAAAVSPHEQKMAKVLGVWRGGLVAAMLILLSIASWTYMNHPDFSQGAAAVEAQLAADVRGQTEASTDQLQNQMRVPVAIAHFLPIGVTGMFFAVMIFLMISTDTTYLHSWGSILIQDIVLPNRKKPFTPRKQMWLLRFSILGVAIFAFIFSLFFNQVTYILMFMALTGSVYLGGAGAVILGGLYWKRGTTAGAWAAMIVGAGIAVLGFVFTQGWADHIYPWLAEHAPETLEAFSKGLESLGEMLPFVYWEVTPDKFPITGQEIYLITIIGAVGSYIGISLLTCRETYNLQRMLHRGEYAREEEVGEAEKETNEQENITTDQPKRKPPKKWQRLILGFDENFTKGDKVLSVSVFCWSMTIFSLFLFALIYNAFSRFTSDGWATYFFITKVIMAMAMGAVTTVWFTIGGVRDLRQMFKRLATLHRNTADDGRVIGNVNADDLESDSDAPLEKEPR